MATVIGIRCWSDRYAYAILTGTDEPRLVKADHIKLPVNESRGAQLATFRNDVQALLTKYGVSKAVFKAAEGNSKSSDTERSEVEGVFQEACFSHVTTVEAKSLVKSQLKKLLSYDGKAGEVFKVFQEHQKLFAGYGKTKYDEAAVTALAGLV